jgi:hypothetical protein
MARQECPIACDFFSFYKPFVLLLLSLRLKKLTSTRSPCIVNCAVRICHNKPQYFEGHEAHTGLPAALGVDEQEYIEVHAIDEGRVLDDLMCSVWLIRLHIIL